MAGPTPADIVGYEPGAVPGSYLFQRRGGNPLVLGGPLAERLKSQIDATAPPDMRVAGPGGGPPPAGRYNRTPEQAAAEQAAKARANPAPVGPPPIQGRRNATPAEIEAQARWRASSPAAQAKQAEEQTAHDKEWASRPNATPAVTTPAAQVTTPEQAPLSATPKKEYAGKRGERIVVGDNGEIRVYKAGTPGQSKAQLEGNVAQGVVTPSRTETVREGAVGGDPDYLENMAENSIDRRLLNQQIAERQAAGAAAETLAFGEEAARAQKRAELEATVAARAAEEGRRAEAEYDQARNEFRDQKVDPNRLFRGTGGALKKIALAIAQAVGAYAATVGRTANFAQQIVQARIEEDIAAQREDIRVRGVHVDNALANLTRKLGDQRAAEAVLRSAQGDYASALMKTRAAASKRPEIIDAAQKWDLDEQQRQIQLRNDYLKERQGKITEKVFGEFAYPKAGSGPVDRPATIEEQMALENLEGKRLTNVAQDQENLAGGKAGEVSDPARKEAADIATTKGRMQAIAKEYGYEIDPATGKVTPGAGAGFPSRLSPGAHAKFRSEMSQLGRQVAGVLNPGSEPTPDLTKDNTPDATALDSTIAAQLEAGYQQVLERERNMGLSDQQRAILEQRKQSVNVQRAQSAAKPLPAPQPVGR